MQNEKMTRTERASVAALSTIMSLRMLGLFMVLPLFTLYASELRGATPTLIGLAMGIYGLTQALFQIPFGMLSDHIGRKPIITLGLLIFAVGSMIAAVSDSIGWMIVGRALQGTGAVGSTIIAMIADLTREAHRTKAMAINGMSIGLSFAIAMIMGPILMPWIAVSGIFWLAVLFSLIAITMLLTLVPTPQKTVWHADTEPKLSQFWKIAKQPQLLLLNSGIFILHAVFTASFIVIPIGLQTSAHVPGAKQWMLYLPALIIGFILTIPCIITAEKKRKIKSFFLAGIALLALSEFLLWNFSASLMISTVSLLLFFFAFSMLEAFLPSLVSRTAPAARKGTALGIYSCSQFLGIFVGGTVGGIAYGTLGLDSVYLFCLMLTILWLAIAFCMKKQQHRV